MTHVTVKTLPLVLLMALAPACGGDDGGGGDIDGGGGGAIDAAGGGGGTLETPVTITMEMGASSAISSALIRQIPISGGGVTFFARSGGGFGGPPDGGQPYVTFFRGAAPPYAASAGTLLLDNGDEGGPVSLVSSSAGTISGQDITDLPEDTDITVETADHTMVISFTGLDLTIRSFSEN